MILKNWVLNVIRFIHSSIGLEWINISQNNWRSRAEQTISSGDHQPTQPEFLGLQLKAADYDYADEDDDLDSTQTPSRLQLHDLLVTVTVY